MRKYFHISLTHKHIDAVLQKNVTISWVTFLVADDENRRCNSQEKAASEIVLVI